MTSPTGFLFRMILFLVAVATIGFFVRGPVEHAFFSNPGLNGVILGVMLIGAAYSLHAVWSLSMEVGWVEAYRRRKAVGAAPLPQPRMLATLANAFGDRDGPIRLSAPAMRSLLDGLGGRLDESREFLRYLIGLQIFLGLLGTFFGLITTVSSLGGVISGLDIGTGGNAAKVFQDLKTALAVPLSGMGTSFSCSMFGLAGALVVGFLDLQTGQAQRRFYNELEEWLSTVTRHGGAGPTGLAEGEGSMPGYIQALLEQTAESLESLQRIVARAEEGRSTANRSLETLADRLGVLTEQMRAEQSLLVKLAEQHIEIQPLMKRLAESAASGAMDDSTRTSIGRLDQNLGRLMGEMENGRRELLQDLRGEIKLLARTLTFRQDGAGRAPSGD